MGYPTVRPGGETAMVKCPKCQCVLLPEDQEQHTAWHVWLEQQAARSEAQA